MKTGLAVLALFALTLACGEGAKEEPNPTDSYDLSAGDGGLLDGFLPLDLGAGDAATTDQVQTDQAQTDQAGDGGPDQAGDLGAETQGELSSGELSSGEDSLEDLGALEDLLPDTEESDTWFPDTVFEDTVQGSKCPSIGTLEALVSEGKMNWAAAKQWCLDRGKTLADICQLRSFVVGCPSSHSSGACGITTECTDFCLNAEKCGLCIVGNGPGLNGCYISEEVSGSCGYYWSSTPHGSWKNYAWMMNFDTAFVFSAGTTGNGFALCVD